MLKKTIPIYDEDDNIHLIVVSNVLTAAKLLEDSGKARRLESKKRKTGKLVEAIQDLGDVQRLAAFCPQKEIKSMAKNMPAFNDDADKEEITTDK